MKANKGAAGVDGQSIEAFDQDLRNNLYRLWNRLSSGSYFPPPVRAVPIPKKSGGERILGVPTVADRIAQRVVQLVLEPRLEPHFHEDSYGYRPGRSAHRALTVTRMRCWEHGWVLEYDIRGLFDNLDHNLLLKALRWHTDEKWIMDTAVCGSLANNADAESGRNAREPGQGNASRRATFTVAFESVSALRAG